MSREEEITRQAKEHARYAVDGDRSEISFQLGAVWADKHPNKNLVNINEVVSWMKVNIPNYYGYGMIFPEIINDFKKAMKR